MNELNAKARYFDSIFPLVGEGIVFVNHEGIILSVNPAFTQILGYRENEIIGKSFYELAYVKKELQEITSHNPLHRFYCSEETPMEMALFDKQGRGVPVRFRAALIRDAQGTVTEAIGIIEQMAAMAGSAEAASSLAEKMWEAQQNFTNVLDHSADAIIICDISGNIMIANKAFSHMVRHTPEEIEGRHIVEFTACNEGTYASTTGDQIIIDADYVTKTAQISAVLFEKGYINFERHIVRSDKVIVPVDITMSVLKDQDGERRGSLAILRDITVRTLAERELFVKAQDLQKTKEQLEKLIDASPDPIVIGDSMGKVMRANKAFLSLLGRPESEVVSRAMYEFSPQEGTYESTTGEQIVIGEDFYQEALESMTRLFEENKLSNFGSYIINNRNMIIPVTENSILLCNDIGEVTASLGILHDITEQRKAEVELIAAKEAAEAANRAKSAFLANMSHEIRTPMNGVIGFTDMLLNTGLDDEQTDYAQTIKRSGEALLALINDILDFSKIEAGHIQIEEIDFDIEMLAYNACDLVRPRLEGKSVEMLCRIGDDVPGLVKGDPNRIRQVMINLLSNAVKFTDQGEIELSLEVEQAEEKQVLIHTRIRDTGIGIARDKLETIFEMFQQADSSTTRKYGGSGLGLSICRQIAHIMGGQCWAESNPGRGSTFHFTALLGESAKRPMQRMMPVTLAAKRILIADDNQANLEILTHMLEAAGMRVTGCTNGSEALGKVKEACEAEEPFDICVLDVNMPGLGGDEVARQIRTLFSSSLPLLACASSIGDGADKAFANGFSGYLPKPIKRVRLYKMIERLLGKTIDRRETNAYQSKIITQHSIQEDAKHSASILLAEDNPVNQKLGVTVLTKAGYTVDVANNGREAVEKIVADPHCYDIILMDLQMPELNGLDATQELRKKGFTKIPIIAMTANAMAGDREKCLEAGMNDYIAKPIKREVVLEMLKKWVFERV